MNYFVYALFSADLDRIYVGQTNDLERRFKEHTRGYSKYTARTNDWALIYSEKLNSRAEAMKREKQLKTSAGRRFLRTKIEEA